MGDDLQRKPQVGCNENRGLSSYSLFNGNEEFEKYFWKKKPYMTRAIMTAYITNPFNVRRLY